MSSEVVHTTTEGEIQIPLVLATPGAINLGDPEVREEFNDTLSDLVESSVSDPTVTFDRVGDALLQAGYELPAFDRFTEEDKELVVGLLPDEDDAPVFLYFAYSGSDGPYEALAEIVSEGELDDLLSE